MATIEYDLLAVLNKYNSLQELNQSIEGKQRILECKKYLFKRVLTLFPDFENKYIKTEQSQNIESIIEVLEDIKLFKKVKQIIKQQEDVYQLIKKALSQKGNKQQFKKETINKKVVKTQKKQKQMDNQVFVRLTPKNKTTTKFMVNTHKFPRLEIKVSINQQLQYLLTHLEKKWLKNQTHEIYIYPQVLEGNLDQDKPLNQFLVFNDLLCTQTWQEPAAISLLYQIKQKSVQPFQLTKPKHQQKRITIITPQVIQRKQQISRIPQQKCAKENSIMFNHNSLDFDKSAIYGSFGLHFFKQQYGNSFSMFNKPSSNPSHLEAILQSIDIVSTEDRIEQNSFTRPLKQPQILQIPVIKKTCKSQK